MIWLLRISYAGQTWRWSTAPVEVDGVEYPGGLDVTGWTVAVSAGEATEPQALPVDLLWEEAAGLVAAGHDLAAATAEVATVDDDGRETLLLSGPVSQPAYGDGVVTLSVVPDYGQGAPVTAGAITETAWPAAAPLFPVPDSIGREMPAVIGAPGYCYDTAQGAWVVVPATPAPVVQRRLTAQSTDLGVLSVAGAGHLWQVRIAGGAVLYVEQGGDTKADIAAGLLAAFETLFAALPEYSATTDGVDTVTVTCSVLGHTFAVTESEALLDVSTTAAQDLAETLLLAGHHVQASQVIVSDGDAQAVVAVANGSDGDGRPVATVDVSGVGATLDLTRTAFTAGWSPAMGCGAIGIDGQPVRGLGSAVEWAMTRGGLVWDAGRVAAARRDLDRWQIDTYADTPISVRDWIGALIRMLPAGLIAGPGGLYVRPVGGTPEVSLGVEAGICRGTPYRYTRDTDEVYTEVVCSYAPDRSAGTSRGSVLATPTTDPELARAAQRYPRRVLDLGELPHIYDQPTAAAIVAWQAREHATIPRRVVVEATEEWAWLVDLVGRPIWWSDADEGVSMAPAVVESATLDPLGGVTLSLTMR